MYVVSEERVASIIHSSHLVDVMIDYLLPLGAIYLSIYLHIRFLHSSSCSYGDVGSSRAIDLDHSLHLCFNALIHTSLLLHTRDARLYISSRCTFPFP